ncbi:MAG TPA: outer membrane protein assembly factor BamD [Vulgatibacter sp.]|nr:outer membrane protein assembly factor BamD [Vulgatibacter sp.]
MLRKGSCAIAVASLIVSTAGCAAKRVGEATYAESAQEAYEIALEDLEDQNYEQAILGFEQVRTKYPYSSYAALAELRIADADFGRGRWLEAIDSYQAFVKFHPTHEQLDWAWFRIGMSHYKAIPSDFFIFPSPAERDQTEVRAARTALSDFLSRYPNSEHAPQAKEALAEVVGLLARHELEVGKFYAHRERWTGAAWRFERVLHDFPGSRYEGEATLGLARALSEQGETERAASILAAFLARNPAEEEARDARAMLESLERPAP